MKQLWMGFFLGLFVCCNGWGQADELPDWGRAGSVFDSAEARVADKSWALALDAFNAVDTNSLNAVDRAWLDFRIQDMTWRNALASDHSDNGKAEVAVRALNHSIRDIVKPRDKGRLYAEILESLGDHAVGQNPRYPNPGRGWTYYQQALEVWAGSTDLDLARERYLNLIKKAVRPDQAPRHYYYGYYGLYIPETVIDQGLRIAISNEDRALLQYMKVKSLLQRYSQQNFGELLKRLDEALTFSKGSEWEDDLLWEAGQFWENRGAYETNNKGQWTLRPDYEKALTQYRELRKRFAKGESRWWDDAGRRIDNIVNPQLTVQVSSVFSPESLPSFSINSRNVNDIKVSLYPVQLPRDISYQDNDNVWDWRNRIEISSLKAMKTLTVDPQADQKHAPYGDETRLKKPLAPGAYLLVARGRGQEARELLLISDTVLLTKQLDDNTELVWVTDAVTGEAKAGHAVRLFSRWYNNGTHRWESVAGTTGPDGLVELELKNQSNRNNQLFAVSANESGTEQAFCTAYVQSSRQPNEGYTFYVVTDRPAYRPGDTLKWKFTARQTVKDQYRTPSGEKVGVRLRDQQGNELWKGTLTLNAFGAAWGELPLTDKMALGLITMDIRKGHPDGNHLGNAQVCRLEEYKLPEFKVSVQTPRENGKPKTFRVGDIVEAEIQADYYYGEAVAGAEVEVIVRMKPVYTFWQPKREFNWFYQDRNQDPYRWQQAQEVKRETLRTDTEGRAVVNIPTQNYGMQTMEFTVEARVVDASRREVTGTGSVRVSPTSHTAHLEPDHALHAPGDSITVTVHTQDANQLPYETKGRLTVTRRTWQEVWLSPYGKEITGSALLRVREECRIWPPVPPPKLPPWRPIRNEYEEEEVFSAELNTGENGEVRASFTASKSGYYTAYWKSTGGEPGDVVEAQVDLWVAKPGTQFTGYHSGPIKIIVDQETVREGEKVMVMLHSDIPGRTILFSQETDHVLHHEVIKMEGEAKVLMLDITDQHVPNVFLEANAVANRQWHRDQVELIVPPLKHFLDVKVSYDKSQYHPGETGVVQVTTTDLNGKPVPTEVTLSALDESVLYIQKDLSGDPRQVFFGTKRPHQVQTRVGFHDKSYVHLPERPSSPNEPMPLTLDEMEEKEGDRQLVMNGAFAGRAGGGRMEQRMMKSDSSMPMSAAVGFAMDSEVASEVSMDADMSGMMADQGSQNAASANVVVRKDFRDTMAWVPDLKTDAQGMARINVVFPDSLTTWNAKASAASAGAQFGVGETNAICTLPLVLRMQHPRFLVAGDTATLSANVHNRSEQAQTLKVSLEAEGLELQQPAVQTVTLPAGEQQRVDWTVKTLEAGTVTLIMKAVGTEISDAMQRDIEVIEHGIDRQLTETAKAIDRSARLILNLPAERREGSTSMTVQVAPSLAVTMLDALPYLIRYPYGCVEQTLSRFMPAVMVRKTLTDQGLSPADIEGRLFGGIEAEHVDKTHQSSDGLGALQSVTDEGLARLYDFQHGDGGWGWWKTGSSDDYMTAYVVWGLSLARSAGVTVNDQVIRRGADYLKPKLVEYEDSVTMQTWMLHALTHAGHPFGKLENKAMNHAFEHRDQLTAYGRALLTIVFAKQSDDRLATLAANLANGARVDNATDRSVLVHGASTTGSTAPGIAWWGKDSGYRHWSEGGIEATAFSLMALLEADPHHELVDPAALWLIKNRRGANWNNTKDTAIAVLALNQYLQVRQELAATYAYTVKVNGKVVAEENVSPDTGLNAPSVFTVPVTALRDGENEILVERSSDEGAMYISATATFFSLEDPIPASGHEVFIKRQYFRERKVPTLLKGHITDWIELHDGDHLRSGERVQVVLTAEAKNDLEYMIFEDRKPAGLEAVQVRSGEPMSLHQLKELVARARFAGEANPNLAQDSTGAQRSVHQELRDRHIAIFADKIPQGFWEVRYLLRAETPGTFHALPVSAEAMYIPEIKGNSDEVRLVVEADDVKE